MTDLSEIDTATDNADWANPEGTEAPAGLPVPALWRILVMPVQPTKKTASGIVIPVQAQDAEEHLQVVGKIVALGPLAYRSFKLAAGPLDYLRILCGMRVAWAPQVGDWIVYGRYTGQRLEYRDRRLIVMNDDEIIAQVADPSGFKVYL
jgi:co-chaperonin GroES (HSP10)